MSTTLETLQKQLDSSQDLASIVRTMKAMAATSVRQYEKAMESLGTTTHRVTQPGCGTGLPRAAP
ncbi:MAG: hypothetical protein AB1576_11040 [Bacillota bacterium]